MSKCLTRQQLYALVWDKPMTKLAKEFGLSDVALHKICRKFRVPTPPLGYWAKKAHGKPVVTTKLADPADETEILIRESTASNEPLPIAEARLAMAAALEAPASNKPDPNPTVERTLTKLSKARQSADGLVRCKDGGLVHMAVRSESVERASTVLRELVAAAEQAGVELTKASGGATWQCNGEMIAFELVEVPDKVEHVATQKELDALAKWKRQREEKHKRYGYWDDWGEPKIPKWEQRYQGRLAIKLEEVRIQSDRSPWGESIMRTFADTRTRDVRRMIPRTLTTIAAMAAAKKSNRVFEAARRAEREAAARRWAEAERRRLQDQQAAHLLEQLQKEQESLERLSKFVADLRSCEARQGRLAQFADWAELRLKRLQQGLSHAKLEERLAEARLFDFQI